MTATHPIRTSLSTALICVLAACAAPAPNRTILPELTPYGDRDTRGSNGVLDGFHGVTSGIEASGIEPPTLDPDGDSWRGLPGQDNEPTPRQGKRYEDAKIRLSLFSENLEFAEIDHDFDAFGSLKAIDTERDRIGFRADFGSGDVGGFAQLFTEDFKSNLLPSSFDNVGIGGGVIGHADVGKSGEVELIVPFKVELDLAAGIEDVGGFDEELVYLEVELEVGFGARIMGFQPSAGLLLHNLVGAHESDDPSDPSHLEPTILTGTNFGGYAEVLYKHEAFPMFGKIRTTFGDVSGVTLALGVAF